jgi:hypothetical protein
MDRTHDTPGDVKDCEALRDQIPRELVNRYLQFHKCRQLFIGTYGESLSVTVRVNDPDVYANAFDGYWTGTVAT